jgi:hypothetical protein
MPIESGQVTPAGLKRKNSDDTPRSRDAFRSEPGNYHPGRERRP